MSGLLILLVGLCGLVSEAAITVTLEPKNTAAKTGQTVQINCTITLTQSQALTWSVNKINSNSDNDIYFGTSATDDLILKEDYFVDSSKNLHIKNLTYALAGLYTCSITDISDGSRKSLKAEVMALSEITEEVPMDIHEGSHVTLSCAVNTTGAYSPRFRLFRDIEELPTYAISNPTVSDGQQRLIQFGYNMTASSQDSYYEYHWFLYYTGYTPNPTYTDSANFNVSVHHSVREVIITPNSDSGVLKLKVGEYVTCTAKGYPNVQYEWMRIPRNNTVVVTGSRLTATSAMVGMRHTYACYANNTVNGTSYSANKTVTFDVDGSNSGATILTPAILLASLLTFSLSHIAF